MREIKFRAWYVGMKEMLIISDIHFSETNAHVKDITGGFTKDFVLMQYTGLKDKNGEEIYEGDIVKTVATKNDHHQRGATDIVTVAYFAGNPSLCFNKNETGVPIFPYIVTHEIEIIGNIYENPELIGTGRG